MMFSRIRLSRWARVGASTVAMAAALTACGGGEQKETFTPSRILAFGDENSLITPTGRIYSVNDSTPISGATGTLTPCAKFPIWVQIVALNYGRGFAECKGETPDPNARMLATFGATIESSRLAINAANVGRGDLVTVMVGSYDVLALWQANKTPTTTERTTMLNNAKDLGRRLGLVVLDVTARGAKVAFSTVPNLGLAPIGLDANGEATEAGRLLSALTSSFNDGLSDVVSRDPNGGGRSGAVVEVDQWVERYRRNVEGYYTAFIPSLLPACVVNNSVVPPVTMADADLVTECDVSKPLSLRNADWGRVFWAGNFHFAPQLHRHLGADAFERLRLNPL